MLVKLSPLLRNALDRVRSRAHHPFPPHGMEPHRGRLVGGIMSKEPSVPPYTLQSPPHYGATYQHQPDTQSFTERQAIVNGNGKGHGSGNGARPSVAGGSLTELLGQFWTRYRPLKSVDGTDDSPAAEAGDD